MGIVHVAIYDAAVAIYGGYQPYVQTPPAPAGHFARGRDRDRCIRHAPRTAAGARPEPCAAGDPRRTTTRRTWRRSRRARRRRTGSRSASRPPRRCWRYARKRRPRVHHDAAGPEPTATRARRLAAQPHRPRARPVSPRHAAARAPERLAVPARRPDSLTSRQYADDFNQVKALGRGDSTSRTPEQTNQALFWTDHDLRQWNDGMLRLAPHRGLDLMQTARMLAMAHVAGGDAMIACFDAKYHYWFWRPYQAIPSGGHRRQPGHGRRPDLAAARRDAELPRVPVGARLPQHRRRPRTGCVLRHRQGHAHARQPSARRDRRGRTPTDASTTSSRTSTGRASCVGFHFRSSDLQGSDPRAQGRPLRHPPLLPAARLNTLVAAPPRVSRGGAAKYSVSSPTGGSSSGSAS